MFYLFLDCNYNYNYNITSITASRTTNDIKNYVMHITFNTNL